MATVVTGDQYHKLDGQLLEIKRQLRQRDGYPFDPDALGRALQVCIEGRFAVIVEPPAPSEQPAESTSPLLTLVSTVAVFVAKRFAVAEHFARNLVDDAPVKFSCVGKQFTEWFGGKMEEWPSAAPSSQGNGPYRTPGENGGNTRLLRYHTLNNNGSLDASIITELGGEIKAETALAEIHALLAKQLRGEQGVLLTNGSANIFYVRDVNHALRAVRVSWGDDGWDVNACSVENPYGWDAGDQVFSRDS